MSIAQALVAAGPRTVADMPWPARRRALEALHEEAAAAAERHVAILLARGIPWMATQILASLPPEDPEVTAARRAVIDCLPGMVAKPRMVAVRPRKVQPPCAVDGCENSRRAMEWCDGHYRRWKRHGDVRADLPLAPSGARATIEEREAA